MSNVLKQKIENGEITKYQIFAITICLIINIMDGFDALAIAFAAPGIAQEWSISPSMLGVLFSSGFLGMVLGSLFLGPFADQIGRRKIILFCLILTGAGMLIEFGLSRSIYFLLMSLPFIVAGIMVLKVMNRNHNENEVNKHSETELLVNQSL